MTYSCLLNTYSHNSTSMRETASYEASSVKNSLVVFSVSRGRQEKKERKERVHKVTQALGL